MRDRLVVALLIANSLLWLAAGIDLANNSIPYTPTPPSLDQDSPRYVIFGWRNTRDAFATGLKVYHAALWPNLPSLWMVSVLGPKEVNTERLFWRTSVGGYKLLAVAILSFAQWYIVGRLVVWLLQRLKRMAHT